MTERYLLELKEMNKLSKYFSFIKSSITVDHDKIYTFLKGFVDRYNFTKVNLNELSDKISQGITGTISLNDFYNFCADTSVVNTSVHPEYNKLASKILAERLHMMTEDDIAVISDILYNNLDVKGNRFPLLAEKYYNFVIENKEHINSKLDFNKDYTFDYFGLRTMERAYLMRLRSYKKVGKKMVQEDIIIERPQHLFMRVALFIHLGNLEKAFESYDLLSDKYFTHATPTLFNAGTPKPQMSSCYECIVHK